MGKERKMKEKITKSRKLTKSRWFKTEGVTSFTPFFLKAVLLPPPPYTPHPHPHTFLDTPLLVVCLVREDHLAMCSIFFQSFVIVCYLLQMTNQVLWFFLTVISIVFSGHLGQEELAAAALGQSVSFNTILIDVDSDYSLQNTLGTLCVSAMCNFLIIRIY